MDAEKAEFKRLIELMGWTQTVAAQRLRKTPSAVNHLVNPNHPNKPTKTMMQLLKLIIASERPDLLNPQTYVLKETHYGLKEDGSSLSPQEWLLIYKLRDFPPSEQEKLYAVIFALLKTMGGEDGKTKK
jgi:hypothetical protein